MVCATSLRYALFGPMSTSSKQVFGIRAILHLHGHLVEVSGPELCYFGYLYFVEVMIVINN